MSLVAYLGKNQFSSMCNERRKKKEGKGLFNEEKMVRASW